MFKTYNAMKKGCGYSSVLLFRKCPNSGIICLMDWG